MVVAAVSNDFKKVNLEMILDPIKMNFSELNDFINFVL